MNSLEALENIAKRLADVPYQEEIDSIEKDLKAYNEIVNADLSEGENALDYFDAIAEYGTMIACEPDEEQHNILKNSLKKAKLLEERENKIKKLVNQGIVEYQNEMNPINDTIDYLFDIQALLGGE